MDRRRALFARFRIASLERERWRFRFLDFHVLNVCRHNDVLLCRMIPLNLCPQSRAATPKSRLEIPSQAHLRSLPLPQSSLQYPPTIFWPTQKIQKTPPPHSIRPILLSSLTQPIPSALLQPRPPRKKTLCLSKISAPTAPPTPPSNQLPLHAFEEVGLETDPSAAGPQP